MAILLNLVKHISTIVSSLIIDTVEAMCRGQNCSSFERCSKIIKLKGPKTINVFRALIGAQLTICAQK